MPPCSSLVVKEDPETTPPCPASHLLLSLPFLSPSPSSPPPARTGGRAVVATVVPSPGASPFESKPWTSTAVSPATSSTTESSRGASNRPCRPFLRPRRPSSADFLAAASVHLRLRRPRTRAQGELAFLLDSLSLALARPNPFPRRARARRCCRHRTSSAPRPGRRPEPASRPAGSEGGPA